MQPPVETSDGTNVVQKKLLQNVISITAVLALVSGVAWYRETHRTPEELLIRRVPGLPLLLDLGGKTCPDCKQMAPFLAELEREYKNRAVIQFVDVFEHGHLGEKYNVHLTPTQVLFDRGGEVVWRHEGFISKDDLKKALAEHVGVR